MTAPQALLHRRALLAALLLGPLGRLQAAGGEGVGPWLPDGQDRRAMALTLRDGKPMLAATVAGRTGVLMIDNGTPEALFLNRDSLRLAPGQQVGQGSAASGQAIVVQAHAAPPVLLAGKALALPAQVRSGNFGFTRPGLGDGFLGFVGTPLLAQQAFVLDIAHRRLTLLRTVPGGQLRTPAPEPADVLAAVHFLLWPGEQPLVAAQVAGHAILLDFDTGDGGTLYATAALRRRLMDAGALQLDSTHARLHGLALGGAALGPLRVRLVEAGGPQDHRRPQLGRPDLLRLGADFLADQPSLWNFPARTITLLKPDSRWLQQWRREADTPP